MNDPKIIPVEAIVIGGSTGSIQALSTILSLIADNFSIPIIVVLHISGEYPSKLAEIFKSKIDLNVKEAEEKETIKGGNLYFAPSNYHLLIEKDRSFSLSNEEPVLFSRPSIDVMFETAAEAYEDRLLGIVLSGSNSDGALGLKKIRKLGGLTMVQDPEYAEEAAMPLASSSFVNSGNKLSLNQIANFLNGIDLQNRTN